MRKYRHHDRFAARLVCWAAESVMARHYRRTTYHGQSVATIYGK